MDEVLSKLQTLVQYCDQHTQELGNVNEELNNLLQTVLENEKDLKQLLAHYLFSNLKLVRIYTPIENFSMTEEKFQLLERTFQFLFEGYKQGNEKFQSILLSLIPALLFIFVSNQQQRMAESALLCIYNCEVVRRNKLKSEEKTNQVLTLISQRTPISSVYSEHQFTLLDDKNRALTTAALKAYEETRQRDAPILFYDFSSQLPLRTTMANEYVHQILRVVLQVFLLRISELTADTVHEMCQVVYILESAGMPYTVPTYFEIGHKQQTERVVAPATEQVVVNGGHSDSQQDASSSSSSTALSITATNGQVTLQIPSGNEIQSVDAQSSSQQTQQEQNKEDKTRAYGPAVVIKRKSHFQKLQDYISHMGMKKVVITGDTLPRMTVHPSIAMEYASIVSHAMFNQQNAKYKYASMEALYAIYMKALYGQSESILLYAQSLLKVLN